MGCRAPHPKRGTGRDNQRVHRAGLATSGMFAEMHLHPVGGRSATKHNANGFGVRCLGQVAHSARPIERPRVASTCRSVAVRGRQAPECQ